MRWDQFRRSDNVEERSGGSPSGFGGGGIRLSGGAIAIVVVVSLLLGKNPLDMLAMLTGDGSAPQVQTQAPAQTSGQPGTANPQKEFVARVLQASTERRVGQDFSANGFAVRASKAGLVQRKRQFEVRNGERCHGPFLLPAR